jgi:hypothetical protein
MGSLIQRVPTLHNTILHIRTHNSVHGHVFTSRCWVAAFNGGRSLSSGFPKYPRPQLPASQSNRLQLRNLSSPLTNSVTNSTKLSVLIMTSNQGPQRKRHFSFAVYRSLPSNVRYIVSCGRCLETGVHATIL